jgi:hypothetical protein
MIGRRSDGGFNTSPTAAYPEGMCSFLADRLLADFLGVPLSTFGWGGSQRAHRKRRSPKTKTSTLSSLWKPGGRLWVSSAPSDKIHVDDEGFNIDANTEDIFEVEVPSKEKVAEVSAQLDELGVHRPIKEGLEDEGKRSRMRTASTATSR